MQSLEGNTFNVPEVGYELLVTRKGFVKGNEVNSDFTGVDECEGDLGWIDPSKVKTNQKVATGKNLHRSNLKQHFIENPLH